MKNFIRSFLIPVSIAFTLILNPLISEAALRSEAATAKETMKALHCANNICRSERVNEFYLSKLTNKDLKLADSYARATFDNIVTDLKSLANNQLMLVHQDQEKLVVSLLNLKTLKRYDLDLRKSFQLQVAQNPNAAYKWWQWLSCVRCALGAGGCIGCAIVIIETIIDIISD